jgi:hypothetical protein
MLFGSVSFSLQGQGDSDLNFHFSLGTTIRKPLTAKESRIHLVVGIKWSPRPEGAAGRAAGVGNGVTVHTVSAAARPRSSAQKCSLGPSVGPSGYRAAQTLSLPARISFLHVPWGQCCLWSLCSTPLQHHGLRGAQGSSRALAGFSLRTEELPSGPQLAQKHQ